MLRLDEENVGKNQYVRCPFCYKGTMKINVKSRKTGWFSSTLVIEMGKCSHCRMSLDFLPLPWKYDPHSQDGK